MDDGDGRGVLRRLAATARLRPLYSLLTLGSLFGLLSKSFGDTFRDRELLLTLCKARVNCTPNFDGFGLDLVDKRIVQERDALRMWVMVISRGDLQVPHMPRRSINTYFDACTDMH